MTKTSILKKLSLISFVLSLVLIMGEACSEKQDTSKAVAVKAVPLQNESADYDWAEDSALVDADLPVETPTADLPVGQATDIEEPSVVSLTLCSGVKDREPLDDLDSCNLSDVRIFTHTVLSSSEPDTIYHVYKFDGTEIARVPLYVGISPHWRTWSSKWLSNGWVGEWTVEVHSATDRILAAKSFTVRSLPEKFEEENDLPVSEFSSN